MLSANSEANKKIASLLVAERMMTLKHAGKSRIREELYAKGVNGETIDKVLDEIEIDEKEEIFRSAIIFLSLEHSGSG